MPRLAPLAFALASALAWAPASGCALFTDLDSSPYHLVDAGSTTDAACDGDASCASTATCLAASDCTTGDVCCLTFGKSIPACTAASSCITAAYAVQICATDRECPAGSCVAQSCSSLGGFPFKACGLIPSCEAISHN